MRWLAVLVALLGAVAWSAAQLSHAALSSASRGRLAPSGFVVPRTLADPACNGGRGIRIAAQMWAAGATAGGAVVATGAMSDGSTLVALTQVYPGEPFAVVRSITPQCTLNRAFGNDGIASIAVPKRLRPAHPPAGGTPAGGVWINTIAPRNGGGAIVAGTYNGLWLVGEITSQGQLDPAFGVGGWTLLPFGGEVTAALQETSGRIVIGGDNGGGGCCNLNWAAALSSRGQLLRGFGAGGRQELPTGEDSGVDSLALEPNGDVLAQVGYGNMGCWGIALAMLTPTGRRVPRFGTTVGRFWQGLNFGGVDGGYGYDAFVGDSVTTPAGFAVYGTGQAPCDQIVTQGAPPKSALLIARFHTDGRPAGAAIRVPSSMYGSVGAISVGRDILLVQSPYANSTIINLTMLRPDGGVDARFGSDGHAQIRAPWRGSAEYTMVSVTSPSPSRVTVVAWTLNVNQLEITSARI